MISVIFCISGPRNSRYLEHDAYHTSAYDRAF